jgi:hypothetical protein
LDKNSAESSTMILPVFDAHMQQETYKRRKDTRDWPTVVYLDSSGERLEVNFVSYDAVTNQIVLVNK